jgi:hypothetical protein
MRRLWNGLRRSERTSRAIWRAEDVVCDILESVEQAVDRVLRWPARLLFPFIQ